MRLRIKMDRMLEKIVLFGMFLWAWFIFGFNTYNPDYKFYEQAYNSYSVGSTNEIGFKILCAFFKRMGMDFQTFHVLLALVLLAIIVKCIYEYTDSPIFAFIAYILYPFFYDAIQIRIMIAEVIILYSVRFLMEYNKRNLFSFLGFFLLAIMFHITSITYAVLLIAYVRELKKVRIISCVITVILILIRIFAINVIDMLIASARFMGANFITGTGYLDYTGKYYRLMGLYFLIGGSIILLYSYKLARDSSDSSNNNFRSLISSEGGVKLAWISLIFIPLFAYGSSFGRLYQRFLVVLYCIGFNGVVLNGSKVRLKNMFIKIYVLLLAFLLFYSHIITGELNAYERVLRSILDNNLLSP